MKKLMIMTALLAAMLMLTSCETPGESTDSSAPDSVAEQTAEVTTAGETTADEMSAEETTAGTSAEETAALTTAAAESETAASASETNTAPTGNFASIAGDWYIDGDPATASIHIEPDGTFKTYYASGNLENEGTIRYESEEIGGTPVYWYMLYGRDGEHIMSFVDDGSAVKTDLYVGNGAYPHYQKFGVGGAADDGRGPGEEFADTWSCGRASLKITQISDTEFRAEIKWGSSATTHVEWDYPLTYQDGRLVCSGKCTKTVVEYASADAEPEKTVEYTNGSGEFVMQGAGVVWNDLTEHSGDDMVFLKTQPE
ncbi:MAG: hypothetical protein IKI77_03425 [Oscillospiraceae bacterium]|nr:hypothetical protein [Oscillospiraceae bacterium]